MSCHKSRLHTLSSIFQVSSISLLELNRDQIQPYLHFTIPDTTVSDLASAINEIQYDVLIIKYKIFGKRETILFN